jgi:hypothetical protein
MIEKKIMHRMVYGFINLLRHFHSHTPKIRKLEKIKRDFYRIDFFKNLKKNFHAIKPIYLSCSARHAESEYAAG